MKRWRVWLHAAAISLPIVAGALVPRVRGAPYPTFDPALSPDRPHLDIPIENGAPILRFHPDPQRRRPPVLVLDETGLTRNGTLICTWPEGTFDVAKSFNMGLVPLSAKARNRVEHPPCPGLPIISIASDLGLGTAALFVEFVRRDAAFLEARCEGKPCYLAMASLPDGWREELSAKESERARRADVARERKKDPALGRFLDGSKACFSRQDVLGCLAPFVSAQPGSFALARVDGQNDATLPPPGPERARAVLDDLWSDSESKKWLEKCIRTAPTGSLSPIELIVEWEPYSFLSCEIRKEEDGAWRLTDI